MSDSRSTHSYVVRPSTITVGRRRQQLGDPEPRRPGTANSQASESCSSAIHPLRVAAVSKMILPMRRRYRTTTDTVGAWGAWMPSTP